MPLPLTTLLLLQAIVLLAFVAEASIGFGATVITVTLAVLLVPLNVILPAFVPINMVLSSYLVVRHARDIAFRVLLAEVAPAVLIGLAIGLALFRTQNMDALALGFALFVVVLSIVELWRARVDAPIAAPLTRGPRSILLLLGGLTHGCFGTGGPMIVYVLQRRALDKGVFRVSLALVWLVLNAALLANFASVGLMNRQSGTLALLLGLALIPSVFAGEYLHRRLSARRFQLGIFSLLLAAGLALAVKTALQLSRNT